MCYTNQVPHGCTRGHLREGGAEGLHHSRWFVIWNVRWVEVATHQQPVYRLTEGVVYCLYSWSPYSPLIFSHVLWVLPAFSSPLLVQPVEKPDRSDMTSRTVDQSRATLAECVRSLYYSLVISHSFAELSLPIAQTIRIGSHGRCSLF